MDRLLFVHRNTVNREGKSPAEWMLGRSVRCPIISDYGSFQKVFYKKNRNSPAVPVRFLYRQGSNTSVITHSNLLASDDPICSSPPSITPRKFPPKYNY